MAGSGIVQQGRSLRLVILTLDCIRFAFCMAVTLTAELLILWVVTAIIGHLLLATILGHIAWTLIAMHCIQQIVTVIVLLVSPYVVLLDNHATN